MSFLLRFFRPFTHTPNMSSPIPTPETVEKATVAAGCFWGVEHIYRHHFSEKDAKGRILKDDDGRIKALINTRVGYIGGDTSDPSYRAVCSGTTGRMFIPIRPFSDSAMKAESQC